MIKCSICSYQYDNWYVSYLGNYSSHPIFPGVRNTEACLCVVDGVGLVLHSRQVGTPAFLRQQNIELFTYSKLQKSGKGVVPDL